MEKQADPLGRSDYVAYWAREAGAHAAALDWPADRIPAVVEALEGAFGADWLRGKAQDPSRYPLTADPKKHPVAHMIASPHRGSVLQLIELAVYLRSCAGLKGFRDVTDLLRVPEQFTTARMQLALAHRLPLCGAEDVELEPRADAGRKADIFFRYGGRSHLIECYEPAPERNAHHDDLLHDGILRVLRAAQKVGRRVIVRVDVPGDIDSFDAHLRKRIEQEARHLIGKLSAPRSCQAKRLTSFEIEVIDTAGVEASEAKALAMSLGKPGAWIVAPGLTKRSNLAKIQRGGKPEIASLGWFVVNAKERDTVEAMKRIADAIESKVSQVRRRSENALGLMVAITDFARLASHFKSAALPLVSALRSKVLATHDGLAGILILDHVPDRERTPYIGGLFLSGREGSHLDGLHAALALRESRRRVIDDWQT